MVQGLRIAAPFLFALFLSCAFRQGDSCLDTHCSPSFSGTLKNHSYNVKYFDRDITGKFKNDPLGHAMSLSIRIGKDTLKGSLEFREKLDLVFDTTKIQGSIKDNRSNSVKRDGIHPMLSNDYNVTIGNDKFTGSIWDNTSRNELVINMFLGVKKINGSIKYCGKDKQYLIFIGEKRIYGPVAGIEPNSHIFNIFLPSNIPKPISVRYDIEMPALETNELLAFLLIDFLWEFRH